MKLCWEAGVMACVAIVGCGAPVDAPSKSHGETAPSSGSVTSGSATNGIEPQDSSAQTDLHVLRQALKHYQQADYYEDRLTLDLDSMRRSSPAVGHRITLTTRYQRPRRFTMELDDGESKIRIASDGHHWFSQVLDPKRPQLSQQLVVRPVEHDLALEDVYACADYLDPARPETMSNFFLALPWDLQHTPCAWCLADPSHLDEAVRQFQTLPDADWQGKSCRRFRLRTDAPTWIYWVDAQQQSIVRIDREGMSDDAQAETVVIPLSAERTAWRAPAATAPWGPVAIEDDESQRYFVLDPPPLPSPWIGRVVPPLQFANLEGATVDLPQPGTAHVLIWFRDHAACQEFLQLVQPVATTLRDQFALPVTLAFTERPDKVSDSQCAQLLETWQVTLPVVRDVQAVGRDVLNVLQAPTLAIWESSGELAWFEVGVAPDIAERLYRLAERLRRDEPIGRSLRAGYESDMERFHAARRQAAAQRPQ